MCCIMLTVLLINMQLAVLQYVNLKPILVYSTNQQTKSEFEVIEQSYILPKQQSVGDSNCTSIRALISSCDVCLFLLMKEIKSDAFAILNCKTVYCLIVQQVAVKSQISHLFPEIRHDDCLLLTRSLKQTKYYCDNYISLIIKRHIKFRFPDLKVTIHYKIFNQIVQEIINFLIILNIVTFLIFFFWGGGWSK